MALDAIGWHWMALDGTGIATHQLTRARHVEQFDILSDMSVREGLKSFSSWPTFPQVYIAGEFVGGLDIVRELVEEGELQEQLHPATSS